MKWCTHIHTGLSIYTWFPVAYWRPLHQYVCLCLHSVWRHTMCPISFANRVRQQHPNDKIDSNHRIRLGNTRTRFDPWYSCRSIRWPPSQMDLTLDENTWTSKSVSLLHVTMPTSRLKPINSDTRHREALGNHIQFDNTIRESERGKEKVTDTSNVKQLENCNLFCSKQIDLMHQEQNLCCVFWIEMVRNRAIVKNCPKCETRVAVATKSCKCGYSFFNARRSDRVRGGSEASSSLEADVDERRRTSRVRREKPNYYDSQQFEKKTKKKEKRVSS